MKPHSNKVRSHAGAGGAAPGKVRPASTDVAAATPNSSPPPRIEPHWTWHYRTLQHLRDRLLSAQADHAKQAAMAEDLSGRDLADAAQEKTDRDVIWAELGAESDRLFEIDCALQRLREGSYGRCEETGVTIPAERLRAIPWTRYSHATAQRHERPVLGTRLI